jgi:hypothetical protein
MKKITICATAALLAFTTINAQNKKETQATHASIAYAHGDDSYLQFSSDTYKSDKKYLVFKFWNAKEPLTEKERTDMDYLKKFLAKKQVEVVEFEWKTEADLKETLAKYGFSASLTGEKHINLSTGTISLNTTSGKALFVLEDNKPLSLCSGKNCEGRLKAFFKMQSFN